MFSVGDRVRYTLNSGNEAFQGREGTVTRTYTNFDIGYDQAQVKWDSCPINWQRMNQQGGIIHGTQYLELIPVDIVGDNDDDCV